jgi:hypothetical protein
MTHGATLLTLYVPIAADLDILPTDGGTWRTASKTTEYGDIVSFRKILLHKFSISPVHGIIFAFSLTMSV